MIFYRERSVGISSPVVTRDKHQNITRLAVMSVSIYYCSDLFLFFNKRKRKKIGGEPTCLLTEQNKKQSNNTT